MAIRTAKQTKDKMASDSTRIVGVSFCARDISNDYDMNSFEAKLFLLANEDTIVQAMRAAGEKKIKELADACGIP